MATAKACDPMLLAALMDDTNGIGEKKELKSTSDKQSVSTQVSVFSFALEIDSFDAMS